MGWSDRAIARARLAAAKALEASQELLAEADKALLSSHPEYSDAKAALAAAAAEMRKTANRKLAQAASTQTGAKVGDATRKGLATLAQLPVLSAALDAAKARHAIDALAARCREDPEEPMHAVRLVEGLDRVQDDLRNYRRVRTAIDPMYRVHRQVIVTAAQLGQEAKDPIRVSLLKRAFVQARRRLAEVPDDPKALHTLARVYLAQGDVRHGALAAALSYRSDPGDPLPLVTLARCHMVSGERDRAAAVAERAVAVGATYANELLAVIVLNQTGRPHAELADEFERLRSRVTPEARLAYLGCQPDASAAWQTFKSIQSERTAKVAQKARELSDGLGT
jgi:hypothetical protein